MWVNVVSMVGVRVVDVSIVIVIVRIVLVVIDFSVGVLIR